MSAPVIPLRPTGFETARAELLQRDPSHVVDALLMETAWLYSAFWSANAYTTGVRAKPFAECETLTVRCWVAVAREARRMHGGGR